MMTRVLAWRQRFARLIGRARQSLRNTFGHEIRDVVIGVLVLVMGIWMVVTTWSDQQQQDVDEKREDAQVAALDAFAEDNRDLIERNTQLTKQVTRLTKCNTRWAVKLNRTLNERDAFDLADTGSSLVLWQSFLDMFDQQQSDEDSAAQVAQTIRNRIIVLERLQEQTDLTPYPSPKGCTTKADDKTEDETGNDPAFVLVSFDTGKPVAGRDFPGTWDNYCFGRRVTIHGTRGADIIQGTNGNDVIFAYRGDDLIVTGPGKDRVCAGRGVDVVNTGPHYDRVNCGRGMDVAHQAERRRRCEF